MGSDTNEPTQQIIGFIGLGVMGEPMCQNLAMKSGLGVIAYDRASEPLARVAKHGVAAAASIEELAAQAQIVILSLPDGNAVQQVCEGGEGGKGLINLLSPGSVIVDMSTSPVELTREIAAKCASRSLEFADAPVARTREAALRGDLSIMVGSSTSVHDRIRPLLACMGTEINHCGPVGNGQMVKILNNMMLFQNVCALAEAMAIAKRSGLDEQVLLSVVASGSGDSFALRNHASKAMLPRMFPERAFSTDYAMKDLGYALSLAASVGIDAQSAKLVMERFEASKKAGYANEYFPAVIKIIEGT